MKIDKQDVIGYVNNKYMELDLFLKNWDKLKEDGTGAKIIRWERKIKDKRVLEYEVEHLKDAVRRLSR